MGSDHLKVFDIKQEPQAVRDAYGNNTLGQGCLLARRLVESGARFVEISYGGWDMHQDIYTRLNERANHLDTALGILLKLGFLERSEAIQRQLVQVESRRERRIREY